MATDYSRHVFINCPFDEAYAPLLRAVAFAIVDSGFTPRCALERSDSGQVRIQKIYQIISECAYCVHDLSRNTFDGEHPLPRFNMPLELGIFLGARFLGPPDQTGKQCLVFDDQPQKYRRYLSDVAGQDIATHSAEPKQALRCVRDWLSQASQEHVPTGAYLWDRYLTFLGELTRQCSDRRQRMDELTYNDLLKHMQEFRAGYVETLTVGGETPQQSPTAGRVRAAIKKIERADVKDDAFVILSKGANELTYIQAARDATDRWQLEYQGGDTLRHFEAGEPQSLESVVARFTKYLEADPSWQDGIEWKSVDVE